MKEQYEKKQNQNKIDEQRKEYLTDQTKNSKNSCGAQLTITTIYIEIKWNEFTL